MQNGETAQKVRANTYARHYQKSARVWQLVTRTLVPAANSYTQPTYSEVVTRIYPVEEEIGEREAQYGPGNLLVGDIKLKIDGSVTINEDTTLLCDSKVANIKHLDRFYNGTIVQEYRIYVDRTFAR